MFEIPIEFFWGAALWIEDEVRKDEQDEEGDEI